MRIVKSLWKLKSESEESEVGNEEPELHGSEIEREESDKEQEVESEKTRSMTSERDISEAQEAAIY